MSRLRVQFAHGLEGSPQGAKARLLAAHFETRAPAMDTSHFEGCVAVHDETLRTFAPDVFVGSSFGGAVAVALLQSGRWRGPTLLLAPASVRRGQPPWLPEHVPIWIVHGTRDSIVDLADSRLLARSGSPDQVRLIEVDDDHPLRSLVHGGRLVELVEELADAATARPDR